MSRIDTWRRRAAHPGPAQGLGLSAGKPGVVATATRGSLAAVALWCGVRPHTTGTDARHRGGRGDGGGSCVHTRQSRSRINRNCTAVGLGRTRDRAAARPGRRGLGGGWLVLCQHGDRRVARLEAEGRFATRADRYRGQRFNSPNDAVFKANGDLYLTDPPYGLRGRNDDPTKELPFNGVYRLAKDGTVTLLTRETTFPNGLAFAPDEKMLYVANSDPNQALWRAFDVRDDGTLGEGRVFCDATPRFPSQKGRPDGMKVDRSGNRFATGPGGVLVFDPDGSHLGTRNTGMATANCGGGDDGSVLYITADRDLCRIRLTTRGY